MTIVINLGLHTRCIGSIFITGIFGNFYTKRGEFLTFRTGIPGGLDSKSLGRLSARVFCIDSFKGISLSHFVNSEFVATLYTVCMAQDVTFLLMTDEF